MNKLWTYQTPTTFLVPYTKQQEVFPEGILGALYLETVKSGVRDIVFWGGVELMDFDGFVTFLSSPKVIPQIYCVKRKDQKLVPIGYCFVHEATGADGARRGFFGFCFFREYWGTKEVRDSIWLSLAYWFYELKIDSLYGLTLAENYLARNVARKFGFTEIATLPEFLYRQGELTDATLVLLNKRIFEPRYQEAMRSGRLEMEQPILLPRE